MIFEAQEARKPDRYPWTADYISAMWQSHWTPNEFSFAGDVQDFKVNMTPQEQQVVVNTLSAIGQIEIAVKKFWANLGDNLPHPSLVDLGFVMANVEVIHNKAYEKLLDTLGLQDVFQENLKNEVIKGRVDYLRKHQHVYYKDRKKQFLCALILFTLFVENVSLFSQFYVVLWFNRHKNVLKDTAQQIQYTKNEELVHAQVGIKLVNTIREEHPELFDKQLEDLVSDLALKAFAAERKVIQWMLGGFSEGSLNEESLVCYVASRINESLEAIGFPRYNQLAFMVEHGPRDYYWMDEEVYAATVTDFFHKRPVDYTKAHTTISAEELF